MTKQRLLIMDDDPHYSGMLALKLKQQFPELNVSSCERQKVETGYNVYILDNDFGGEKCAAKLAEEIRRTTPECLVVILSATLEFDMLKRLVNCHAAGVFDKSDPDEINKLFQLIDAYLASQSVTTPTPNPSFLETVNGIKGLISSWNKKLEYEDSRS